MSRYSKSVALLIPAAASLLSLAISTSVMAERAGHRGAVAEQENTVAVDDNNQDNRPRRRGEQARTEQAAAAQAQVSAEQAPEVVRQSREQPERMRQENNMREQNNREQNESRNNARIEFARQQQERENARQRQQEAQQNAQNASVADRIAAGERLAMQRSIAENARQNRQAQTQGPAFSGDNRNDRNDRDNNNGRRDHNDNNDRNARGDRNDRNDRDNNGDRGNPIARKPYQQPDQRQWQEQQQRQANDYRRHLDGRQSTGLRIVQNLRSQNRNEQYRSQQRYYDRMNQQRRHHDHDRNNNDYYRGSYHYSPVIYRYNRGGSYYYANRYQADLMRQAINYGYEEGYYAGRADRMDRWGFNYRDAYAYQDANYGYSGYYVDRGTYNYYFRQGFSRGYDDGYYSRYRYGRHDNNNYSLNDSVFRLILNFSNWR